MSNTVSGPRRVPLDQLGQYKEGSGLLELRFTNTNDSTEVWLIPAEVLERIHEAYRSEVKLAYLDSGVDIRLSNQRAAIERLQQHVESHHADLASDYDMPDKAWACTYQDASDAPPA